MKNKVRKIRLLLFLLFALIFTGGVIHTSVNSGIYFNDNDTSEEALTKKMILKNMKLMRIW